MTDNQNELAHEICNQLISLSQDLICIAGLDGYFKFINPAWQGLLGYSETELLSRPFGCFIHPDDQPDTAEEVARLAAGNLSVDFENRYLHKNGSIRHISWRATPVPEKQVIYCIGRDVTGLNQTEAALRESTARYRAISDASGYGVFLASGKLFLECNEKALSLFGCSREELIDHSPLAFSPRYQPDGRSSDEKAREIIRAAIKGEPQFFEWRHCKKDGTLFDAEVSLSLAGTAESGKGPFILSILRDITDRKRAEQLHGTLGIVANKGTTYQIEIDCEPASI